ncbi:MAG: chromate resistance protein [Actinobacteria bacterium]|nr:chromate resistance protein [Actinomycetota bacterium]
MQLKGTVYILPYNEEHYEFFQWLVSEIVSLGGEGAFARVEAIENMEERDIVDLFNRQREEEYGQIEKGIDELERRANSIRQGSENPGIKALLEKVNKYLREFDEVKRKDFFASNAGIRLEKRLKVIEDLIKGLSGIDSKRSVPAVVVKRLEEYQGKRWVTRKRPFVDRMASAWLIRKFIDEKATFDFIDEEELKALGKDVVAFDAMGAEFTHQMDMCTFEVLIKSFRLKSKALKNIAEIVHELDIKDDRHKKPEAKGVEEILIGIRKTAKDDRQALEQGMVVFEMLYASMA